jgi:hypothetical protein
VAISIALRAVQRCEATQHVGREHKPFAEMADGRICWNTLKRPFSPHQNFREKSNEK